VNAVSDTSTPLEPTSHGCRKNWIGGMLVETIGKLGLVTAQVLASARLVAGCSDTQKISEIWFEGELLAQ
jgi:hypothetical protein